MKKNLLLLMAIIALSLGTTAQVTTYSIGDVVADFTVTDTDGNEHSLYEITATGKHVYLDFFFDTCGPCQGASPYFGEFYDKYGCNGGEVYCLVINNGTDDDEEVIAYEEEFGGPGNHAPAVSSEGGSAAVDAAFGVGAYPTFCMIGPDNKLIESDIWPVSNVSHFEATFGGDFDPAPMACSAASIEETTLTDMDLYPNPASEITTLTFASETADVANITIYNIIGEVVEATNVNAIAGNNLIEMNVADYKSGSYIVQIQLGDAVITSKLEVLK